MPKQTPPDRPQPPIQRQTTVATYQCGTNARQASPELAEAGSQAFTAEERALLRADARRYLLERATGRGRAFGADPEFQPYDEAALEYCQHRCSEIANAHGGAISAGVAALIETASMRLAASRYLWKRIADGDRNLLRDFGALCDKFRADELAAWELAARESKVHHARARAAHADINGEGRTRTVEAEYEALRKAAAESE